LPSKITIERRAREQSERRDRSLGDPILAPLASWRLSWSRLS